MSRFAVVILRTLVATVVALGLLAAVLGVAGGSFPAGFAEAARRLFLFMDIGLGVWLVLLIVGAVRGWSRATALVGALVAALLNLVTVAVVGFVQSGALPWEFLGWAAGAGLAFLLGATVAVAAVKPRRSRAGDA